MTEEQYKLAQYTQDELYNLKKMLYGYGDSKIIKINSIDITQEHGDIGYTSSASYDISRELSDIIVEAIKSRIVELENQFKNI